MPTHEVTNQPPPLAGYDAADDPALLAALAAFRPGSPEGNPPDGTVDERDERRGPAGGRPPRGRRARAGAGQARQREPAEAAHATTATATGSTRWSSTRPGTTS